MFVAILLCSLSCRVEETGREVPPGIEERELWRHESREGPGLGTPRGHCNPVLASADRGEWPVAVEQVGSWKQVNKVVRGVLTNAGRRADASAD